MAVDKIAPQSIDYHEYNLVKLGGWRISISQLLVFRKTLYKWLVREESSCKCEDGNRNEDIGENEENSLHSTRMLGGRHYSQFE